MHETEIKILEIDRNRLEKKLTEIGARRIFDGDIFAVYYDDRQNSIKKNKNTLRLRKEGDKAVLTFKSYVENAEAKVRGEKEVSVSDFDTMKAIIESAGFVPWLEMRKHRITYEASGVCFDIDKYLDEYNYIPEFLEIEAGDSETVFKYAEILGFNRDDCKPWDAVELAEFYRNAAAQKK